MNCALILAIIYSLAHFISVETLIYFDEVKTHIIRDEIKCEDLIIDVAKLLKPRRN